jgi:hypothetical protein
VAQGKITNYGLWEKGVVLDKDPTKIEDNELRNAQNAYFDDAGDQGALCTRDGFLKLNSGAAAGSILGLVGVPIARPVTRTFLGGRYTTVPVLGWNVSTDEWATAGTSGGPDSLDANGTPRDPQRLWTGPWGIGTSAGRDRILGGRPAVTYRNKFYYAGNDYTAGMTAPTIRVYDGVTDSLLTRIPPLDSTQTVAILCMIAANGQLYVSTYDTGNAGALTVKVRIFAVDPYSGAVRQLGSRFPLSPETVRVPYALAWHWGRLWTHTVGGGITSTSHVYVIRPDFDADWTLDVTNAATLQATQMLSFNGSLYIATISDSGAAPLVRVRDTTGAYATSRAAVANEGGAVPAMAGFGVNGHFGAMVNFNGALYVAFFNQEGIAATGDRYTRIYKFDGMTWTIPYSPAKNTESAVPFHHALVHNGKLYFISSPAYNTSGSECGVILKTSDGASYTIVGAGIFANFSTVALGVVTS